MRPEVTPFVRIIIIINMKIEKWKTLSSEYLIQRPWLTARRDSVELPDGRVHPEYYVLEYPAWVNVIAVTPENRFVMIEQYRHGLGDVFIELVAGVVEDGEEPQAAARRELLEEAGYAGGDWELLTVLSQNPSTTTNLTYCYLARGVVKVADQHLDATEDIAVHLLTEAEVRNLLARDAIKQSLMAAPLWKYLATK